MYYVYILRSLAKSDETYIGYTERSPDRRLQDHNAGLSTHTNKFKPWKIIWFCAFVDQARAKQFEHYLKTASGIAFRNKRLINRMTF